MEQNPIKKTPKIFCFGKNVVVLQVYKNNML